MTFSVSDAPDNCFVFGTLSLQIQFFQRGILQAFAQRNCLQVSCREALVVLIYINCVFVMFNCRNVSAQTLIYLLTAGFVSECVCRQTFLRVCIQVTCSAVCPTL